MFKKIKNIAKKFLSKKAYGTLVKIFKRKPKTEYYSVTELSQKINQFSLKKIAIIYDWQTNITPLFSIPNTKIVAIYSFDLDCIGKTLFGLTIQMLKPDTRVDTDGWIVSALNETAGFSLNKFLLHTNQERQVILQHVKYPNTTKYYSYVDFFSNEQKTVVQINNYFRRCYALPFPLDIRLTLRDCLGKIVETRQLIIPPDALKVIRSEDFKISNFIGYIEVEFEISKKVTPFLHYMADYSSKDFISSNHQSGLGLNPAHSAFTRGYIPTEKDRTLVVCLFQHNYDHPITIKAILNYTDNNKKLITKIKDFPPLGKKEMQYTDMKKLFSDVDFSKVHAPVVVIDADVPLHRPNFYYAIKNKEGYYDTSHSSPDLRHVIKSGYRGLATVTDDEIKKMQEAGITPMDMRHQILPNELGIDSIFALGNDTTSPIEDFRIDLYDQQGKFVKSFEEHLDFEYERYLNLNKYLQTKGLPNFTGTVAFRPGKNAPSIPININGVVAFMKRNIGAMTSTAGNGSNPDNIPFYFRGGPQNYLRIKSSASTTDIFARGRASNEFDTYYIVSYQTANKNLTRPARYEIQIINADGEKKNLYKTILPNGYDLLKLSDMVKETGHQSKDGFYTVWIFSSDARFDAQHILERTRDGAIAFEHLYAGRFGL